MKDILLKIQQHKTLNEDEMIAVMRNIMDGKCEDSQIAAFLMGLSIRGETVDELSGAARVMREKALKINAPEGAVDCCGTGGDGHGTYNISTAVAIVSAACGVPVAKHGNRASTSKSGAGDVLDALGVNLDCPKEKLEEALHLYNFAFLMAPNHHSAMKHVGAVRKSIGVRTMFNILGPLANPAQTKFQLLGVYKRDLVLPIAQVLQKLGTQSAWVVCGADRLDEITVTDKTYVAVLKDGKIEEKELAPIDFGLETHSLESLKGGNAQENATALTTLLNGEHGAYRDIVLANTSAVLNIRGLSATLKDGVQKAADAIDSGKARDTLDNYISFTRQNGA